MVKRADSDLLGKTNSLKWGGRKRVQKKKSLQRRGRTLKDSKYLTKRAGNKRGNQRRGALVKESAGGKLRERGTEEGHILPNQYLRHRGEGGGWFGRREGLNADANHPAPAKIQGAFFFVWDGGGSWGKEGGFGNKKEKFTT